MKRSKSPNGASRRCTQLEAELQQVRAEREAEHEQLETRNDELLTAQRDLEAAYLRLRDLHDYAPVGYLVLDGGGCIREANLTAAAEMLGAERRTVIGMPLIQFVRKQDRRALLHHLAQLRSGRTQVTTELTLAHKGAPEVPVQIQSERVGTRARGRLFRTTLTDIRQRKEAEQALKRSNERFSLLAETAGQLLATDDPQRAIEELCNKVMKHLDCQMFCNYLADEQARRLYLNVCNGVPKAQLRKIQWLDYGVAVCGCVARDGARIVVENVQASKDKRTAIVRPLDIQAYACHPLVAQGKLIGTLSFGTRTRKCFNDDDLSLMKTVADQVAIAVQRIRGQDVLRHERAVLDGIMKTTDAMLVYLDTDFNFLAVNPAYAQTCKMRPEEMIGKNHFALYPHAENEAIFKRVRDTGKPAFYKDKPFEFPDQPERGVTYWDWSLMPVKNAGGKVTGLVFSLQETTQRKLAEEAVRVAALFPQQNPSPVLRVSRDGKLMSANPASKRLLRSWGSKVGRSVPDEIREAVRQALDSDQGGEIEVTCHSIIYAISVAPIVSDGYANLYAYDVSRRKRSEAQLIALNRTLRAMSNSNQVLMRVTDEATFLNNVCRLIVKDCGHAMVWIGYAEDDKRKTVRPVASAGFKKGYIETLKVTWADAPRGRGPTGTAIRTAKACLCRNMLTDPKFAPWRKEALKRGYASSIALPLLTDGKPFGALMIYSKERDPFTDEEVRLLSELANDLAQGISVLRLRAAHVEAEKAVRESEKRYRRLFEDDLTGDFIAAPDGRILFCNPAFVSLFGFADEKQALRSSMARLHLHADSWREFTALIEKRKVLERYECRRKRRDGNMIDIVENVVGVFDDEGKLTQIKGYAYNDTLRKRAEEELLRERDFTSGVLSAAGALVIVLDRKGRIVRFNRACEKLSGYTFSDVKGRPFWDFLVLPEEAKGVKETFSHLLEGLFPNEHENYWLAKDGTRRLVHWSNTSLAGADGRVEHIIGTGIDITEQREAEAALREVKDKLEIRVTERTAELSQTNERLQEEVEERIRTEQSLRLEEARLDALLHLSQISDASPDETTNFTLEQAIKLTQSEIGFVGFMSEDETAYTLSSVSKDVTKECKVTGDPMQWQVCDAGIWADAIRERKTQFVNDYRKPHPHKKGIPAGHVPIERFMVVPVSDGGKIVALAGVGNKACDYDKSDERQVTLLLHGMWSCMQKSRAREQLLKAYDELEEKVEQRTAELRESRERLALAQQSAGAGVWGWDIPTGKLNWSPELFDLFGLDPTTTEATFEAWRSVLHPEDRQIAEEKIEQAVRDHVQLKSEYRVVRSTGEVRWINSLGSATYDKKGVAQRMSGICIDVTERKNAEAAVRESEQRLAHAQEIAHLGSWELDLVNDRLTWSDEVYRIFGLEPQEFGATYEAFLDAVHPEDRAAVDEAYSGSLRDANDHYEIEHRVVRKSTGEVRWVHEKCEHVRDAAGKIVRSVGMVLDVTERKNAEVEILRAKEQWERTFNTVPDLIALLDERHRIVRVNKAMAERLGTTPDECIGQPCYRAVHGTNRPPNFCPHALTLADGKEHTTEVHEDHLGGDFLVSTTPLFNGQGERAGSVHVARDITERKEAEQRLQDQAEELAAINEELRTQTEELQAQAEELATANEELQASERDLLARTQELEMARAEAESERLRLEAVMEALPVGVAITDREGGTIRSNDAFEQVWRGPTPKTQSIRDYAAYKAWWADTGKAVAANQWASALAVKKRQPIVGQLLEIQRFDGSRGFVLNSASPIRDVKGKVVGSAVAIQDITDLRKAQEALRQSEARLRVAVESAELGLWDLDPLTGRLDWSPRCREIYGVSPDEPIDHQTFLNRVHPDDRRTVDEAVQKALSPASDGNFEMEYRCRRPDGTERSVLAMCRVFFGTVRRRKRAVRVIGTILDITERKRAEALRLANAYNRSLIEASLDPLVTIGPEGKITDVNLAAEQATGCSRDELIGTSFSIYFTEPEKAETGYQQAWLEGSVRDYPLELRHRDGSVRSVLYNASVYHDEMGNPVGVFAAARDITDRKKAEQAVQIERKRFSDVLDMMPAYVILLSPDHHVPFANRYFCERFGQSNGHKCYEYLFGRTEPCEICETFTVFQTHAPHHWEWAGPDGRIYDIHDFPFTDTDGSSLIMEMGIDITERKNAEQSLHEEIRQRSLAQEQLKRLTLELSQTEDRERQRLAQILHDDLQQLLVGAQLHLNIVARKIEAGEEPGELLLQVRDLIKESIDKSRGLSHELSPPLLYQSTLAESLSWLGQHMRQTCGLTVQVDAHEDADLSGEALKTFTYKAAQEMLFNVVKHARVNTAKVQLRRHKDHVRLIVSDEGRGFDPGAVAKTDGFGLFSIQERARLLGGWMKFQSTPGSGSVFVLTIPETQAPPNGTSQVSEASAVSAPTAVPPAPAVATERGTLSRSLRVLLVDDHKVMREGVAALLEEQPDIEVVGQAGNGREAISLARQLRPDVIVMDVTMPILGGDEATRQIKAHLSQTRIIGLSLSPEEVVSKKMLQAGAECYLSKTDPAEKLLAAIRGQKTKDREERTEN
jgi:PAS domain S-box-containing protein